MTISGAPYFAFSFPSQFIFLSFRVFTATTRTSCFSFSTCKRNMQILLTAQCLLQVSNFKTMLSLKPSPFVREQPKLTTLYSFQYFGKWRLYDTTSFLSSFCRNSFVLNVVHCFALVFFFFPTPCSAPAALIVSSAMVTTQEKRVYASQLTLLQSRAQERNGHMVCDDVQFTIFSFLSKENELEDILGHIKMKDQLQSFTNLASFNIHRCFTCQVT